MPRFFRSPLPILIVVSLTAHMALSGGRLSGSLFSLRTGAGTVIMGIYVGLFAAVPLFTSLSVGHWIDRKGSTHVMRRGVALVFMGAWLPVLHLSMPMLFGMALLLGIGFNLVSMSSLHAVGILSTGRTAKQRLANFGWYGLGFSTSATVGPGAAGLLIDRFGFQAAFAVMACCSTTALLLVFGALRDRLPEPQPAPLPTTTDALAPVIKPAWHDLLGDPVLRRVFIVSVTISAGWDLFVVMLPVVGTRLGYSASMVGGISSMFALGIFTSRALTPWLATRFAEWQNVRASLLCIVFVLLAWPLAQVPLAFMVLGFMFGGGVGLSQVNTLSLLHAATPPTRGGEALGLRYFLGNCSSVLMPLVCGVGVGLVGVAPLLWTGAALVATGLPSAQRALRSEKISSGQA